MSAQQTQPEGIDLTPERLKGLSHPTRVAILGILRTDGPSTATAIAKTLGTNSGATSYHLRQLERHGFVQDTPSAGNARERYWEALHAYTNVDRKNLRDDPDAVALLDEFTRLGSGMREAEVQQWVDTQDEWGEAWQDAVAIDDLLLHLTASELKDLAGAIRNLVKERTSLDPTDASTGASLVHLHLVAVPVADPLAALRGATKGMDE